MASDDPLGLCRRERLLRLGAAAEAWFEASWVAEEAWSMDDVQAAWERLMDVMLEEVRHVRH
jgi:hypothetical protein